MRILLAPIDIAGQARITAKELNEAGHYARFFDGDDSYLGYENEDGQEFALKELPSLGDFDVFDVFFGAFVPMGGREMFPKHLKFVHHFCGSDVRQIDIAKEKNPFVVVKGSKSPDGPRGGLRGFIFSKHLPRILVTGRRLGQER